MVVDAPGIGGGDDSGTSLGVSRRLALDRGAADGHRVNAAHVAVHRAVVENCPSVTRREHVYRPLAVTALKRPTVRLS